MKNASIAPTAPCLSVPIRDSRDIGYFRRVAAIVHPVKPNGNSTEKMGKGAIDFQNGEPLPFGHRGLDRAQATHLNARGSQACPRLSITHSSTQSRKRRPNWRQVGAHGLGVGPNLGVPLALDNCLHTNSRLTFLSESASRDSPTRRRAQG